jgi:hypothetical protein
VEYLFLLIFLFFIVLNVVIGLASSRSKKRKRARDKLEAGTTISHASGDAAEQPGQTEPHASILQPQTAESIVESLYKVEEEKASLPGGEGQITHDKSVVREVPGVERSPEQIMELGREAVMEIDQSKPMIDITKPSSEVKLSFEEKPLESEVESRVVEEQREREEKFQIYGLTRDDGIEVTAWEHIHHLPPLQRAIILSEVLGAPKALSEGHHPD